MDSRLAWYSVGASSTQLDAGASSYSLLHSIYGSQVSQLPFSDFDSEASLIATQSEQHVNSRISPTPRRRLSRPKSSPASVIAAREQLRSKPTQQARPGSALNRQPTQQARPGSTPNKQPRPGSAARRIVRGRPASAAVGRPSSAASTVSGGASPSRRRPKTAMGFHRPSSMSGSSTLLLDLEEEEEGDTFAPIIRDSQPVRLTHTPEYFDFWQGKPLRERDFGVKMHKRKSWQRPKSDYGTHSLNRNRNKENGDGKGDDSDGVGGLETLLERDGDSSLNSRRGSRDFGRMGDMDKNKSGLEDDSSKLSISGEGLDSRRGSKDLGGKDKNKTSLRERSTSRTGLGSKQGSNKDSSGGGHGLDSSDRSKWADQNGAATADDDDYFKNSTDGSKTLLPAISTRPNTNLENVEALNRIHSVRERRALKQLQPTECVHEHGKALASVSWMDGAASGSGNVTRFELPMDMKTLEVMSPLDYLNVHCIVSKRRMARCSKIFSKLDKKNESKLNIENTKLGLVQAHHNCVTDEQATSVLDFVQLTSDKVVSPKLFAALCCFAERTLNLFFLPLARKDVIEAVDFEALDWKLRNCTISDPLRALFSQL